MQQTPYIKPVNAPSNVSSSSVESNNNTRRSGIKTRSPRPAVTTSTPTIVQSPIQTAPLISTVTPAALVVAKPLDSTHTLTLSSQPPSLQPILPTVRFILINIYMYIYEHNILTYIYMYVCIILFYIVLI